MVNRGGRVTGTAAAKRRRAASEFRIRVGGVEIRVAGGSREDCLRQLEAAAEEVDREELEASERYTLTAKGRAVLAGVA
jgi:hypothetical protein